MESKSIQIYKDRAYHLSEKIQTEYEAGQIRFVDHDGENVNPKIFGRSGDGFNVTFRKTDNNGIDGRPEEVESK